MRCVRKESRVQQLAWFREQQGDVFSEQVKKIVQQKWKKK
jgi:predicted sugar kinase